MLNWFNWLQSASAEGESSAPGPQGLLGEDSDEDDEVRSFFFRCHLCIAKVTVDLPCLG